LPRTIFSDVDTQYDFMMKDGKLYVPSSESIVPNLERLTDFARRNSIQIVAFMDSHSLSDPEISQNPDFTETFPPHCIDGSSGWLKIDATKSLNPLYVESRLYSPGELEAQVAKHSGDIIIKKNRVAIMPDPNAERVLKALRAESVYVYGVALDFCVKYAIEGFLGLGLNVKLVEDATKAIYPDRAARLIEEWARRGAEAVRTADVVKL